MPNQRNKNRNKLIAAYVSDETMERIKREAALAGMSVADYVRALLQAKLDERKNRDENHD